MLGGKARVLATASQTAVTLAGVVAAMVIQSIDSLHAGAATPPDREPALEKAGESVRVATVKAAQDRSRPSYHLVSPANWINDPNGPLFYKGTYHLFYQHNPYGDAWGNMHWGHWTSRNLATWEHRPIALWPSKNLGEEHCFSGCAVLTETGKPMIFYTSIGKSEPQCWIALPEDDDLAKWRKFEGNPVLTEKSPDNKYYDFRDPYVFSHLGKTYMVHGGNLNQAKGGEACVSLYEALNTDLTQWRYKSILFKDPSAANIECPNFFKVGKDFVLITSPHRRCDYFIGSFDAAAGTFTARARGVVEPTDAFYAPNTLQDPDGRWLMWGWIRGFKNGLGWNGCMTLPRVVSIQDDLLIQTPASEITKLRGPGRSLSQTRLTGDRPLPGFGGRTLELGISLNLLSAASAGVLVRAAPDGSRGIPIVFDGKSLVVDKIKTPLPEGLSRRTIDLRIFLDGSVMEVFAAGGRVCVSKVIASADGDAGVVLTTRGGEAVFTKASAWPMRSMWQ